MSSDQLEDETLLRDANTTPLNTSVDNSFGPIPSDILDCFMPRNSDHESSLETDEEFMTEAELFVFATGFEEGPMADSRYSILDLEDEPIVDAIYYSMVDDDDQSLSNSRSRTAQDFERESLPDGNVELVSDHENTLRVTSSSEGALALIADTGTFSSISETSRKSKISDQKRAKENRAVTQEPRQETMEIKLLRAESKKEKLMHVIRDLEKVIADKEDECKKAAAELRELTCKFRDAQNRTLLREAYVEQMHAQNQELIHEKKLSEVEKKRFERKMQNEIDRQKKRSSQIQIQLGQAIKGVQEMFDAHTTDHANRVEVAEWYEKKVEDQNEQLLELLHFMEDTRKYVWSLQMPGKDVFYEAEVNLLRSKTLDWTGPPPATEYQPNGDLWAMQYRRENDEISDDFATSHEGIAVSSPKSSVGGAYMVMAAPWSSDEISDGYASSSDQLALIHPTDNAGPSGWSGFDPGKDLTRVDTLTRSVSNFHLAYEENVILETSLLRLSEEDFEINADEECMVPETQPGADKDIDTQICSSHASHAEKTRPVDLTRRQLLPAWRDAVIFPDPAATQELTIASKNLRGRRLKRNKNYFNSPLNAPLTSPIFICADEDFNAMDADTPLPYFTRLPSYSPPSKRICLSRLRSLAWDSPIRDHFPGQVLFQERLKQGQAGVNVSLRQPVRSPFAIAGSAYARPDSQTATPRTAREDSGWSLSIGHYLQAMISRSSSENTDGAYVESSIILYHAHFWNAFAAPANLRENVLVAIRMILMCMMMWLAYNLRAYDEWKLANGEPTTLEMILETMHWRTMQIGLVDTARFGIHEWLEERTWLG
ncbi:uncharacterized protein N7477_007451 [Penicillium maclennaniae]|uniref:uncharacterized protein n=1 Tax=Penicillium maclennaniae TaxID=1343394 RepID=UPI0025412998|nr:uncharacterized protein N7477_007451 [Penicillium maclennaniae]KAJ5665003.1 hypothetical protein N7477_007451 [Penicillium maclennaniae]